MPLLNPKPPIPPRPIASIDLSNPVTISAYNNGIQIDPIVFTRVEGVWRDHPDLKCIAVNFTQPPRATIVISGDQYSSDITDDQVNQAISNLIGSDPQAYFQSLM